MNNHKKYICKLEDYQSDSPRIIGFQKLKKVGLPIPEPIYILTHEAFKDYEKKGLSGELVEQIEAIYKKIKEKNPRKGIAIRRAYIVPGMESPPGPRSSSTTEFFVILKEVKKIFDFAVNNKFNVTGSEIAIFLHPYINPKIPLGGGCVTGNGHGDVDGILVESIYGNDEGVQSFPHDDYILDHKKNKFIEKKIHYKNKCLSAINQLEYRTLPIPRKLRNTQVLDDQTILKIGRHYRKFTKMFGQHRLEFDVLKSGIYYIEATPYKKKDSSETSLQTSGKVSRIRTIRDVNTIKPTNRIIFVDPKVIKTRNMDLLTYLACNLPEEKIILYPGSTSTAHASIIFREMGHTVIYIGYEIFEEGEEVLVKVEDGQMVAKHQMLS